MATPDVVDFRSAVVGGAGATSVEVDVSTLGIKGTDLVLAIVSWRGQVDIAASEAGWTERHDVDQANGPTMAIYERHGDGGNASFTFELTAGLAGRVCAAVARVPNAEVEASDVATGTSTTPTAPDVEAGGGTNRLILRAWSRSHIDTLSGFPPDDYTSEWNIASGGAAGGHVDQTAASAPVTASGAVGEETVTIGASRNWCAATLIIAAPAPSPTDLWDWLRHIEREGGL
jgi:hypothetical protein